MKKTTTYVWGTGDITGGRRVVLKKGTHIIGFRQSYTDVLNELSHVVWFVVSASDGFTPFEGTQMECSQFLTTENAAPE